MDTIQLQANPFVTEKVKQWFDEFVADIRKDQLILETNLASKETETIYKTLISGSETDIIHMSRVQSSLHFIRRIIYDYMQELNNFTSKPNQLSLDLSDSKVLIWAVINDSDDQAEKDLILTEAKLNAKYHQYGFHVTSTILEKSDNYPIPPHYQSVYPNKK